MKNQIIQHYGFAVVTIIIFIIFPIRELESLFCHRCLAIECKGEPDVCESVRDFITKELRPFYYIGDYLQECPEPDNIVEWRKRELGYSECETKESEATCSLGRIRVTTPMEDSKSLITHATILGCAKVDLLKNLKPYAKENKCNDETSNGTRNSYKHYLEVEHCPQLSDYCMVDFCVIPAVSGVKPYRSQTKNSTFDYGILIIIIVAIVIIFIVVIAASLCRSPLNRTTNYSPTQAQASSSSSTTTTSNSTPA